MDFIWRNRIKAIKYGFLLIWSEKPQPCPLCGGKLDFLHKKAKKSNSDWICTVCNQRYDAIKILKQLNDE